MRFRFRLSSVNRLVRIPERKAFFFSHPTRDLGSLIRSSLGAFESHRSSCIPSLKMSYRLNFFGDFRRTGLLSSPVKHLIIKCLSFQLFGGFSASQGRYKSPLLLFWSFPSRAISVLLVALL